MCQRHQRIPSLEVNTASFQFSCSQAAVARGGGHAYDITAQLAQHDCGSHTGCQQARRGLGDDGSGRDPPYRNPTQPLCTHRKHKAALTESRKISTKV
ncbi:hypothetical protein Q5P01_011195 [Channa striata]|uniref:Uncharacterized protein n=1 Tax=Channa striata TaxID=64152 RepID=A0AA88MSU7_CHASR|nr:hypothetical protein Q5P01_011195 [Channa striata]